MELSDIRIKLLEDFRKTRAMSMTICEPLEIEDYVMQSMPDASPPKWHLAHTTWFFEVFVLLRHKSQYQPIDLRFHELFNSYYDSLGTYVLRAHRGLLSRPRLSEVLHYRKCIDDGVCAFIESCSAETLLSLMPTVTLGLHHEQQHQELLITDIKHAFYTNPLHPTLIFSKPDFSLDPPPPLLWLPFNKSLYSIGAEEESFAFDHERPRHEVYVRDFELASRLVTNAEFHGVH